MTKAEPAGACPSRAGSETLSRVSARSHTPPQLRRMANHGSGVRGMGPADREGCSLAT